MKRFKDFVYDKNDILIALLVLVAAAFIILWRMEAIMEYPSQIFSDGEPSDSQNIDTNDPAQSGESDGDGDGKSDGDNQGDGDNAGQPGADSDALWAGGVLTRDVEVEVTGTNATAAISCLVEAGLFDDYAEYQTTCQNTGLDHEKVSAGTMTFEKGSTKADIARQINWS